ncbi:MAG: hypothetical protein FWE08_05160 [Oscillospiraceae bacterium]|nr:hypothetical protein [Oscillospiraceae bacterium]
MNLHNQIFLRKSVRKYQAEPLEASTLQEIADFIGTMRPLLPEVSIGHRFAVPREVKGMLTPKAPHFVVISGEAQPYRDLCAGFLFQQLDLYLSVRGLGACWLGVTKGREKSTGASDILSICFGAPVGDGTRTVDAFKRKSLAEISTGEDSRLEAARLAPSGRNLQPWHFIAAGGLIHVYKEIPGKLWAKLYNLEELDAGIALCHLALATEAEGGTFRFETGRQDVPPAPGGFIYVGTVTG